ncbi:MAG: Uma2 family endonuclease [Dehalococcoidia bacterium]
MPNVLRHLTVTGFLLHEGRVLLHWHRRNQLWLPMGGHIEPNEDPIQTVLREVAEESGIAAEVIPIAPPVPFTNVPQRPPPVTIILAPVKSCSVARDAGWDGPIEHIDLIYYCRPTAGIAGQRTDDPTLRWLNAAAIATNIPVAPDAETAPTPLPDDVRILALDALRVAAKSPRLVTADELLHMPEEEDGTRYELDHGRLIPMGSASPRYNEIAMEAARRLGNHVREHKLGRFGGSEGGFLLASDPDTVRAPDVWFVRGDRVPGGRMPEKFFVGAPDLVVEVLSPTDRPGDIWRRVGEYLDAGARLVWVLDPNTASAAVFPPDSMPILLGPDGVLDAGDVVPGFKLPLREVFDV